MIEQKVKAIMAKQMGMLIEEVELDDRLVQELGADSLDLLDMVMAIEQQFGIAIHDHEYDSANTVGRVIALVESKLDKTPA